MAPELVKRIVAFETGRYFRDRMTWAGLAAFSAIVLIGAIDYWNSLPPRPNGSRLFTEACVVLLSLAFHTSVAQDRVPHFDRFLVSNFVQAQVLYCAKIISAAFFLFALAVIAFLAAVVAALGDVGYAAEHAILFFASALVLLPLAVIFELVLATRYTVPLILALFLSVMAVLNSTGDLPAFLHWAGFDDELTAFRGLVRTAAAAAASVSLYPLYRRRIGMVR